MNRQIYAQSKTLLEVLGVQGYSAGVKPFEGETSCVKSSLYSHFLASCWRAVTRLVKARCLAQALAQLVPQQLAAIRLQVQQSVPLAARIATRPTTFANLIGRADARLMSFFGDRVQLHPIPVFVSNPRHPRHNG
jgi:hypothetical protein